MSSQLTATLSVRDRACGRDERFHRPSVIFALRLKPANPADQLQPGQFDRSSIDMATSRPPRAANLVVLLLLILFSTSAPIPSSALRFHRQHMSVNILNALPNAPLQLRCQSHDNHLDARLLQPGHWFGWGFEANVLGTTLFWCDFVSGSRSQSFTVFQDIGIWGKQPRPCRQCVWVVRPDGFYRSENGGQAQGTKVYDWK